MTEDTPLQFRVLTEVFGDCSIRTAQQQFNYFLKAFASSQEELERICVARDFSVCEFTFAFASNYECTLCRIAKKLRNKNSTACNCSGGNFFTFCVTRVCSAPRILVLAYTDEPTRLGAPHQQDTSPDLTFITDSLANHTTWQVFPDTMRSDHFPVIKPTHSLVEDIMKMIIGFGFAKTIEFSGVINE
ncbi:hypothetical protein C0J52_12445 [Blattella germanica]|nr:hypothetical protein C0J52_12445 [Blattella germanica]